MDTAALQSALDELNSILGEAQPERVRVIQCDAMVHRDNDGDEDDPVKHRTFEVADYAELHDARPRGDVVQAVGRICRRARDPPGLPDLFQRHGMRRLRSGVGLSGHVTPCRRAQCARLRNRGRCPGADCSCRRAALVASSQRAGRCHDRPWRHWDTAVLLSEYPLVDNTQAIILVNTVTAAAKWYAWPVYG